MKLSDYIIGQLADWGVRHIFLVTGGGAMHLNDSMGRNSASSTSAIITNKLRRMAAEAYA